MNLKEAMQLAELTMVDAEAHGFDATATAMRHVLNDMLAIQRDIETTQNRSTAHLQALPVCH